MDGHDAPGTLYHELDQEGTDREEGEVVRKCPKRDQRQGRQSRDDNASPPAETLRERAEENAATYGADIIDDRDDADEALKNTGGIENEGIRSSRYGSRERGRRSDLWGTG